MRLLYVGDTGSPHFRAWPAFFGEAGHEVHAVHLSGSSPGPPIEGVQMHRRPVPGLLGIRGAWVAAAVPLRRLWRRLRPDLVHSHQVIPSGFVAELGKLGPHVATAWGSEVLLAGRLARRPIGRVARGAELLTADSRHLLAALEGHGADPARLRWVPWGVSSLWRDPALAVSAGEAAERAGLPAGRPIVLSHRGIREIYRPEVFVRAMAELRARGRDYAGVVIALDRSAGRAESEKRVRALITLLGVQDSVRLVPPLSHEQIAFAYRAAAACVSVPVTDSAPTSVFEALSLGTPVVVSDLPWVREPVYRDARLAVVAIDDHAALADAMEEAVERPSEEEAAANRALVARHLDRDRTFAAMGREYERLVST